MFEFEDVADKAEDERIALIGAEAMKRVGLEIAFITDSNPPEKVERYIRKLAERFPDVKVVKRFNGLVAGTVSVIVTRSMEIN